MTDFILDYIADKCICITSEIERKLLERGISMYLLENGIEESSSGRYYERYVSRHLALIDSGDIKSYFVYYPLISEVNQICIEFECDGSVSEDRKNDLYRAMRELHETGLGEKYIPVDTVKSILGKLS